MSLVTISELAIRFRGPALFENVSFRIEAGQRIGLLGRNGAGKTTLMKMLCGTVEPDAGSITFSPSTRVAILSQEVPQDTTGEIQEIVAQGLAQTSADPSEEPLEDWQIEIQVEQILSRMELDPTTRFESL